MRQRDAKRDAANAAKSYLRKWMRRRGAAKSSALAANPKPQNSEKVRAGGSEKGTLPPWRRPWRPAKKKSPPFNVFKASLLKPGKRSPPWRNEGKAIVDKVHSDDRLVEEPTVLPLEEAEVFTDQPVEELDEVLSVEEPDANLQMEETDVNPKSALAALPEEGPDNPPQEEGPIDLTVDDKESLSNGELVQRCRDAID